jgi:hypothetical protein
VRRGAGERLLNGQSVHWTHVVVAEVAHRRFRLDTLRGARGAERTRRREAFA